MNLTKSTIIVSICILISRITGYIREMIIAYFCGTGYVNDAFIAAFKITNLFRNIFAEGAFNTVFTPLFIKIKENKGEMSAKVFAVHIKSGLIIILLLFSLVMMFNMERVISFTTPGFKEDKKFLELATNLGIITFPYLSLISIAALYGSLLNSYGKFFPYTSSSSLMNIISIFGILILVGKKIEPVFALAYSVIISGFCEIFWMLYWAKKNNLHLFYFRYRSNRYTKEFFKKMLPAMMTSGLSQINVWVDMLIVSFVPNGMSYVYYSDRVAQLPLAIIGTAISITFLPKVARYSVKNMGNSVKNCAGSFVVDSGIITGKRFMNRNTASKQSVEGTICSEKRDNNFDIYKKNFLSPPQDLINLFNNGINWAMFLAIPSSLGLFYFNEELVYLLFFRGAFGQDSLFYTSKALECMSLGIPVLIANKIINNFYYGRGDIKTPTKILAIAVFINGVLGWYFLDYLQHVGVVLASVISAYCSFFLSIIFLKKKYMIGFNGKTILNFLKYFLAAFLSMELVKNVVIEHFILDMRDRIDIVISILIVAASYFFSISLWMMVNRFIQFFR